MSFVNIQVMFLYCPLCYCISEQALSGDYIMAVKGNYPGYSSQQQGMWYCKWLFKFVDTWTDFALTGVSNDVWTCVQHSVLHPEVLETLCL